MGGVCSSPSRMRRVNLYSRSACGLHCDTENCMSVSTDMQFSVSQWSPQAEREYKFTLRILEGELQTPPIPFPLRGLRGEIVLDNHQILVPELTAESGQTRL